MAPGFPELLMKHCGWHSDVECEGLVPVHIAGNQYSVYRRVRGTGPHVFFVHGWLHSADIWSGVLEATSSSYTNVSIDLPGFGRSPPLPPCRRNLDLYADIVYAAITCLCQESGCYAAVGDSLGAILLLHVIRNHGRIASRVLLSGCPIEGLPGFLQSLGRIGIISRTLGAVRAMPSILSTPLIKLACLGTFHHIGDVNACIVRAATQADPETAEQLYRQLCTSHDATIPQGGWAVPTAVIRGQFDRVARDIPSRKLAEALHAAYVQIPSAGHTPMVESPAAYSRALLSLLRE